MAGSVPCVSIRVTYSQYYGRGCCGTSDIILFNGIECVASEAGNVIRLKLLPPFTVRLLYDSVVGLRASTTLLQIPQSYTTFNRPEPIDETLLTITACLVVPIWNQA